MSRLAGAAVLVVGVLAVVAVLWVRSALGDFRVEAVEARLGVGLGGPGVEMVVTGHNPLPFAVTARRAVVRVAVPGKPVQVGLGFDETARFPPGDFRVPVELLGAGVTSFSVALGEAEVPGGGDLGFAGTMTVAVGPIEREVPFKGAIRFKVGSE